MPPADTGSQAQPKHRGPYRQPKNSTRPHLQVRSHPFICHPPSEAPKRDAALPAKHGCNREVQGPAMPPGPLLSGPWCSGPPQCRAGRQAWHLPPCLPPNPSFLWVRLQCWEVCPVLQAREVTKSSFPTPRGTHTSGRGSAGRLHHSPIWQLAPHSPGFPEHKRGPRIPTAPPGREGETHLEASGTLKTRTPSHHSPGLPETGTFTCCCTVAQDMTDKPVTYL